VLSTFAIGSFATRYFDFVALRFGLVAAHASQFRIGEHAERHDAILRASIAAIQVVTYDPEVMVRDVRESRTARAVAHRPYVGCRRFEPVIYFAIAALVEVDADLLQSNAFRFRRPTHGDEEIGTLDDTFTVSVFCKDPNVLSRMAVYLREAWSMMSTVGRGSVTIGAYSTG
jgi:hypothetical protein